MDNSCLVTNKDIFSDQISNILTESVLKIDNTLNSISPYIGMANLIPNPHINKFTNMISNYPIYKKQFLPIITAGLNQCLDYGFEDPNISIEEGKVRFDNKLNDIINTSLMPLINKKIIEMGIPQEYIQFGIPILNQLLANIKR